MSILSIKDPTYMYQKIHLEKLPTIKDTARHDKQIRHDFVGKSTKTVLALCNSAEK